MSEEDVCSVELLQVVTMQPQEGLGAGQLSQCCVKLCLLTAMIISLGVWDISHTVEARRQRCTGTLLGKSNTDCREL